MSDEEFEDYDNTSGSSLPEEFRLAMGRAIIDDEPEERLQGKLLRDSERDKRRKKLQAVFERSLHEAGLKRSRGNLEKTNSNEQGPCNDLMEDIEIYFADIDKFTTKLMNFDEAMPTLTGINFPTSGEGASCTGNIYNASKSLWKSINKVCSEDTDYDIEKVGEDAKQLVVINEDIKKSEQDADYSAETANSMKMFLYGLRKMDSRFGTESANPGCSCLSTDFSYGDMNNRAATSSPFEVEKYVYDSNSIKTSELEDGSEEFSNDE